MKVNFVIPSHNCVTFLPHAVSSALQQTHRDIQVIIVDDGSTDRTHEYLDFIAKDERVKVIRNSVNLGRSYSRNIGNREATEGIICVLDADDLATPNRAELTVKKFKSKPLDYVYGSAQVIDVLGRPSHILGADSLSPDVLDEAKNPGLQNRIVHSTVAYTVDFADKFPYRDGQIAKLGVDDWAQQAEAIAAGARFDFIPQRLACYRVLSSQITKNRDEAAVMAVKKGFLAGLKVAA